MSRKKIHNIEVITEHYSNFFKDLKKLREKYARQNSATEHNDRPKNAATQQLSRRQPAFEKGAKNIQKSTNGSSKQSVTNYRGTISCKQSVVNSHQDALDRLMITLEEQVRRTKYGL